MKSAIVCLLLIAWNYSSFAESAVIPLEIAFPSPDGLKFVKLLNYDREYHYSITNLKTGNVSILEAEYDPIFAITWSPDSQSIFVTAHVARGILVQVLHLSGNDWRKFTIDVPDKRSHESTVLDWIITSKLLTLVCQVTLQKENGRNYGYYKAIFDVDPSTGNTSNLRKKPLTVEENFKLKSKFITE